MVPPADQHPDLDLVVDGGRLDGIVDHRPVLDLGRVDGEWEVVHHGDIDELFGMLYHVHQRVDVVSATRRVERGRRTLEGIEKCF